MDHYLMFYIVAGLLLLAEAFSPGIFIFICFAVATLITALVAQFTALPLITLLVIDLVISVIALFLVRPVLKTLIKVPAETNPAEFGSYAEKLMGKEAMVFKPITKAELGLVKLIDIDETWLAKSSDGQEIGQGSSVLVDKVDGNHLIVSLSQ